MKVNRQSQTERRLVSGSGLKARERTPHRPDCGIQHKRMAVDGAPTWNDRGEAIDSFTSPISNAVRGGEDGDNSPPGDAYEYPRDTHSGRRGISGHRGRKRGPGSMGRFPFLTRLTTFLDDVRPFYAPLTHQNLGRKLRQVHRILQELKDEGIVETTNPMKIGQREIGALLEYMNARDGHRGKPLSVGTQECLLGALAVFLGHEGNPIISQMKSRRTMRVRKNSSGPLPCPSDEQVREMLSGLAGAASEGDTRCLGILGLSLFGAYAGLRPKEIRLADRGDLSTEHWKLTVMHPKGEGAWGSPRKAMVVPAGRPQIEEFLAMRAREYEKRGLHDGNEAPLVPCFRADGTVTHWSSTYALQVKGKLEASLGLSFDFRMLRRAFGQNAIDRGARIDSVSVALGHKTTRTTETYYARRKEEQAFADIEEAWLAPRAQLPLIEQ